MSTTTRLIFSATGIGALVAGAWALLSPSRPAAPPQVSEASQNMARYLAIAEPPPLVKSSPSQPKTAPEELYSALEHGRDIRGWVELAVRGTENLSLEEQSRQDELLLSLLNDREALLAETGRALERTGPGDRAERKALHTLNWLAQGGPVGNSPTEPGVELAVQTVRQPPELPDGRGPAAAQALPPGQPEPTGGGAFGPAPDDSTRSDSP